jgi:hypothetical protein
MKYTVYICHDKTCDLCSDKKLIDDVYANDKVVVKKTLGESGIVSIELMKRMKLTHDKQSMLYDEAKKVYKKTIQDAINGIEKLGELYDKVEEMEINDVDKFSRKLPICKREHDFNGDYIISNTRSIGWDILGMQEDLIKELKDI